MNNGNIDLLSIANRKAFSDVDFQRNCLMSLFEVDRIKPGRQAQLKAILRGTYPNYLPAPDSCPVLIRFSADKVPHFEFHLRPKPLPKGCPEFDCDKEVAFYSSKIYNILKKDIDRENAGLSGASVNEVPGTPATAAVENYEGGENETYQEASIDEISNNNNFSSSIGGNNWVSFNGQELPTASSTSNSISNHPHRHQRPPPVLPFSNIKQEEPTEETTTFMGSQAHSSTSNASSPSSKRKSSSTITDYFVSKAPKQTSSLSVPVPAPADANTAENNSNSNDDNNNIISRNDIYNDSAMQSFVSADETELLVYSAFPTLSPNGKRRLICPLCSRPYSPEYLKEHINVVHFNKKPYQCLFPSCKFQGGHNSNVRKHVHSVHKVSEKWVQKYIEYIEYID